MLCSYKETEDLKTGKTFVDPKLVGLSINFSDELGETEILEVCVKLGVVPVKFESSAAINEAQDLGEYYVGWGSDADGDWPGSCVTFKVSESGTKP